MDRRLRLFLGGVQNALGDLHILQRELILIGRQLLGFWAEPVVAQITDDKLQTPPRLFGRRQRRPVICQL